MLLDILKSLGLDPKTTGIILGCLTAIYALYKFSARLVPKFDLYLFRALSFKFTNLLHLAIASRFSLLDYTRKSLDSETTKFLYVPGKLDDKPIPIDDCFVPLRMLDSSGTHSLGHADLIPHGNRVCVIGDPGSGKSTIIKRVFREECRKALRGDRTARMPILLNLRDIVVPKAVSVPRARELLIKAIADKISTSSAFEIEKCYRIYSASTGVLVLLDGLDEVASKDYKHIEAAISQLSTLLANGSERNAIILTMRTQFYRQVNRNLSELFPLRLEVRPFTPSDVYVFLNRWPFASDQRHHILRIYNRLNDVPTLREMCSNPLILSMYVVENEAAGYATHIESRTNFYRKVVDELLYRRRSVQLAGVRVPQKIREQRLKILGRMAYEHLTDKDQPANHLSWPQLLNYTKREFKCSENEAEALIWEMSKETGLFTQEQTGESFRFIHLTFCEFLAALYAVEVKSNEYISLIAQHKELFESPILEIRTRLSEAVPFCCGLVPSHSREAAIAAVCRIADFRLQALAFLEAKAYDGRYWSEFKHLVQEFLLETLSEKNESWLHLFRLLGVVLTDAEQSVIIDNPGENSTLRKFVELVSHRERDVAHQLVLDYMAYDAPAAVDIADLLGVDLVSLGKEELITNCDQPALLAMVCKMAAEKSQETLSWATILAEAGVRSAAVTQNLRVATPISPVQEAIRRLPARALWHDKVFIKRQPLTDWISFVLNSDCIFDDQSVMRFVNGLPRPRKMRLWFLLAHPYVRFAIFFGYYMAFLALIVVVVALVKNKLGIDLNKLIAGLFKQTIPEKEPPENFMVTSLILMAFAGAAFLLSICRNKARFLAKLYQSIVHQQKTNQTDYTVQTDYTMVLATECVITTTHSLLPLPNFLPLRLLSLRGRMWFERAFYGKATYAAITDEIARLRAGR